MKALLPLVLAFALATGGTGWTADFFGKPDKSHPSPPSVAAPTPVPTDTKTPPFFADGAELRTAVVGTAKDLGKPFREIGPASSMLVGFEYTTGPSNGLTVIQSLVPIYLQKATKTRGAVIGSKSSPSAGTVLEARPGFAVGAIEIKASDVIEGIRVIFYHYEDNLLDPTDSYPSPWIGRDNGTEPQTVRTFTHPIIGVLGKADTSINAFGLLTKKEIGDTAPPSTTADGTFFGRRLPGSVSPDPMPSSTTPAVTAVRTTPKPAAPRATPMPAGNTEVFACADDQFTLFLNGRQILTGSDVKKPQTGRFDIAKGDVLSAVVVNKGGEAWFSMRVVRDGKTVIDAGDMLCSVTEPPSWKASRMMSGFQPPKIWSQQLKMGGDSLVRAVWAAAKDASATTVYLKVLVP